MAVYSSADLAFILIGGYSLLGNMTEIRDKVEALTGDLMTFGDSWPEPTALGVSRAEMSQRGFFNDANDASHEALDTGTGISRVFCYGLEGNTIGKRFIGFTGALQADYERIASLSGFHQAVASYRGSGKVDLNGLILQNLAAKTATGDTQGADSQDNGASSAAGGAGYLQVSAYSGFTNVVLKVRHSADDVTYADLITFATVTSAPTAERLTVSGTVNRHVAASWTVTGAGSITFFVGFKRD